VTPEPQNWPKIVFSEVTTYISLLSETGDLSDGALRKIVYCYVRSGVETIISFVGQDRYYSASSCQIVIA